MGTKSFTPVWHPSIANDYFTLSNNLSGTNNILYYDSAAEFIEYPKVFKYNRINDNYNLKLNNVITNTASDNPTYSPSLPATTGTFTINKIAPDNGSTSPTIDLYCIGEIQKQVSYGCDYPGYVGYGSYYATITPNTFPNSGNISVHYEFSDRYIETSYIYYGDTVRISSSWTTKVETAYQANGTINYPAPTQSLIDSSDQMPTIYVYNWVGTGYNGGSVEPGGEFPWAGEANGHYNVWAEPRTNSIYVGEIGQDAEHENIIVYDKVSNEYGDYYQISYDYYGLDEITHEYGWITAYGYVITAGVSKKQNP